MQQIYFCPADGLGLQAENVWIGFIMLWPLNFKLLLMVDVKSLLSSFQDLCKISEFLGRHFPCQQPLVSEKDDNKLQGCSQDKEAVVWWETCMLADVQASVWL